MRRGPLTAKTAVNTTSNENVGQQSTIDAGRVAIMCTVFSAQQPGLRSFWTVNNTP